MDRGFLFLKIACFFLVSAPVLSSIFFLLSGIISLKKNEENYFQNNWNYPFLICTIFLIISYSVSNLLLKNDSLPTGNYLSLVGLFNWIPFFVFFWLVQIYLKNPKKREAIIISYIVGSIPQIISGLGQLWFGWEGPIGIANNLIIWFQRPISQGMGITGVFNNANYAGIWYVMLMPMCIACFIESKNSSKKKLFIFILLILISYSLILTKSRNALLNGFLSLVFLNQNIHLLGLLIFFVFLGFVLYFLINPLSMLVKGSFFVNLKSIIYDSEFISELKYNLQRFEIWPAAIKFISEKPLLGWGASSFPVLYNTNNEKMFITHSHNLFLELAISYGMPAAIIFTSTIILILYRSFIKIYFKDNNYFEKAWWIVAFTLFVSHLFDILYFDIRISISFWLFLAGLVNIIREKKHYSVSENI